MTSGISETLRENATQYSAEFDGHHFSLTKPYMQAGKEKAILYDSNNKEIASIILSFIKKPRFKK